MVNNHSNECHLFGPLGIAVQCVMGVLVIIALVVKRHIEKPRRIWKIFLLDASKQFFSSGEIHLINTVFAVFFGNKSHTDQCGWYMTSILIDVTLGIFINYSFIKLFDRIFTMNHSDSMKSGNYFKKVPTPGGHKVAIDYCAWFKQILVWCFICLLMKIIVITIQLIFASFWESFSEFILQVFIGKPNLKLICVVIIFPVCVNIMQFVIQDQIVRKKDFSHGFDQEIMKEFYENEAPMKRLSSSENESGFENMSRNNKDQFTFADEKGNSGDVEMGNIEGTMV